MSGRLANTWPALMKLGPSSVSVSRSCCARRRTISGESSVPAANKADQEPTRQQHYLRHQLCQRALATCTTPLCYNIQPESLGNSIDSNTAGNRQLPAHCMIRTAGQCLASLALFSRDMRTEHAYGTVTKCHSGRAVTMQHCWQWAYTAAHKSSPAAAAAASHRGTPVSLS
jgi:hypothetical protein